MFILDYPLTYLAGLTEVHPQYDLVPAAVLLASPGPAWVTPPASGREQRATAGGESKRARVEAARLPQGQQRMGGEDPTTGKPWLAAGQTQPAQPSTQVCGRQAGRQGGHGAVWNFGRVGHLQDGLAGKE